MQLQDLRWIVRDGPSPAHASPDYPVENLLDDQIDIQRAASVTQEKSLLTIADENETVMGMMSGPLNDSWSFRSVTIYCSKCEWLNARYAAVRRRFHVTKAHREVA